MNELMKFDSSITMQTTEGRQAIMNKIKELEDEHKDDIFFITPTMDDILASLNFKEYLQNKQGLKKAILIAVEKSRTHTNFRTNTIYSYIDNYMNKNNITSLYIQKAVHDIVYNLVTMQEDKEAKETTVTINGQVVEENINEDDLPF